MALVAGLPRPVPPGLLAAPQGNIGAAGTSIINDEPRGGGCGSDFTAGDLSGAGNKGLAGAFETKDSNGTSLRRRCYTTGAAWGVSDDPAAEVAP